jgi:hypothetical protein
MKKFVLPLIAIGLVITLVCFIPTISKGIKVNQLEQLSQERARCEELQLTSHDKAEAIRTELGLISEQEQPQRT